MVVKVKTSAKRRRRKSRQETNARLQLYFVVGFAVLALVVVVIALVKQVGEQPLSVSLSAIEDKVASFEQLDSEHVPPSSPKATYNSNPPTSGPHYGNTPKVGVFAENLPDEVVLHNLEHGHVWASYRDPNDQEAIAVLTDIQRRNSSWVIVTYRPENDLRIAVASWTKLMKLDEPNAEYIQAFASLYKDRAPESVPG